METIILSLMPTIESVILKISRILDYCYIMKQFNVVLWSCPRGLFHFGLIIDE